MIRFFAVAGLLMALGTSFVGCSGDTPQVQKYQAPAADPLVEAKTILGNYAKGMPVTSEAESFPDLVNRVKEKDPAKGEVLEKGFAEIKANPASAQAKATELLKQL